MNGNLARLLLTGPTILTLLIACLAVTALLAAAFGRLPALAALGDRAADRLHHGRIVPPLWGLAAALLTLTVAVVLYNTKVLALLGILVLALGLVLVGLGTSVAALRVGQALAAACGQPSPTPLAALGVGLTCFSFAAVLPLLGWITVLLAIAAGLGAVLETLVRRG